jgi:hypothetical protein
MHAPGIAIALGERCASRTLANRKVGVQRKGAEHTTRTPKERTGTMLELPV